MKVEWPQNQVFKKVLFYSPLFPVHIKRLSIKETKQRNIKDQSVTLTLYIILFKLIYTHVAYRHGPQIFGGGLGKFKMCIYFFESVSLIFTDLTDILGIFREWNSTFFFNLAISFLMKIILSVFVF